MILAILSTGLVIFQVYVGEGTARYEKLKILSPSTVFQIGEKFSHSTLPPLLAKIIYNRPVYFLSTVSKNYLSYFSPSFFNQTWGAQFQFAIPNQNLLTLPVYLLAFLGIFSYLRNLKTNKSFVFLYTWLLLSPLAASLTVDPPQALRPNPMIPALMIFACLGLVRLLLVIPPKVKNLVVILVSLWILVSFLFYVQNYTTDYAKKYSSSWQYGYRPVVDYINEHGQEYQNIFITKRYGEPHLFYAFYSQLNPRLLQPGADNIRFTKSDWFWTDKIGKIYFVNDWQIPEITVASLPLESGSFVSTAKSLLVTSPDHVPVNAHVLEKINFLDGSPAYIITSIP